MKNSEQKKLDQILRDKLSGGTAQVPDFVWDRIEEELFPEKKRRGFFWWFFGGFCTLLISTILAIGLSGSNAHSEQAAMSKQMALKNPKSFISKKGRSKKTDAIFALNSIETKRDSNYRKYTAVEQHSMDSKAVRKSRKSIGKSRYFGSKNQLNYGSSAGLKNTLKTIEKSHASLALSQKAGIEFSSLLLPEESGGKQSTSPADRERMKTDLSETNIDSLPKADSNLDELLALIKRDFPVKPTISGTDQRKNSRFSLGVFGGPSLYHSAVFKDYFTSGQLSKRTFVSSGFELGLQAQFKLADRFKVYAGLAFNQKQTQFSYNLAITQADYFTYIVNNEKVPVENIRDDGMNSCFLANDVTARYQMQSVLISLEGSFEFLRFGRFSAAADIRLSGNIHSSLKLREMQVLDIAQPQSEKFSYLQPGAGLSLNFRLNQRFSVGLAPFISKQFYLKKSFSRKLDELVIPLTLSFDF